LTDQPIRPSIKPPSHLNLEDTMIRATLLAIALLLAPLTASADYLDVIGNKLNDGCSFDQYLGLVKDFRGVMKSESYGYTVEIAQPRTGEDLTIIWWIGRTKDLATFQKDNARWEAALMKSGSPEAKLNDKLTKCSTNVSRNGSITR
jgi:hypothetical protein